LFPLQFGKPQTKKYQKEFVSFKDIDIQNAKKQTHRQYIETGIQRAEQLIDDFGSVLLWSKAITGFFLNCTSASRAPSQRRSLSSSITLATLMLQLLQNWFACVALSRIESTTTHLKLINCSHHYLCV
jgi:isopropylmalate/homocitrate/citramalate synthase